MASKLRSLRRLSTLLKPHSSYPSTSYSSKFHPKNPLLVEVSRALHYCSNTPEPRHPFAFSRSFCSPTFDLDSESQGPAAIDYRYLLSEDEFHKLADSMIHDLQEKFEEYGDSIQIDGFDIDYGNEVLTLKLGDLGTYVLNKQTPNRQLWLSSPVSGPSRFDWDRNAEAWIYRRTKANLLKVFENELGQLCGEPIKLV
ncbi:frataxin, mitochondrial [Euphorbia lathyris]|uniref:frataxin, mitochondrial n=1 Tax=Euphorbia lathyris TaxID=212925 RepID=UPI0033134498